MRGLSSLDAKKQKRIMADLAKYTGPHRLMVWIPQTAILPDNACCIIIPEKIDQSQMKALARAFEYNRVADHARFMRMIFAKSSSLSLESALLLCMYGSVIGSDVQVFAQYWLDQLFDASPSLFMLSQHFFDKDVAAFGNLWKALQENYSLAFWTTFWSEQLFRAASVVRYASSNEMQQAKKIGFRLPFSFLSSGWRRYTVSELVHAHEALYMHDVHMKNGGDEQMIELFYAQFFNGVFKASN